MASFTLGGPEVGPMIESDFAEFISITRGRSVISGADHGEDHIEFGLSGDGLLRIFSRSGELHANFMRTSRQRPIAMKFLR